MNAVFVSALCLISSTSASSVARLPEPQDVHFSSVNLRNIVRWTPGDGSPDGTVFSVEYAIYGDAEASSSEQVRWRRVNQCSSIAQSECDLSQETFDLHEEYYARVRAVSAPSQSLWSESSLRFRPLSDTVLGAPLVEVNVKQNYMNITIKGPFRWRNVSVVLFRCSSASSGAFQKRSRTHLHDNHSTHNTKRRDVFQLKTCKYSLWLRNMSSTQAESVIKNIIREIAHACSSRGQSLSETLIAFMVKAVVLDPRNHFNVDRTLTKQDVQKLIELCVDRLTDQTCPTLHTIKMQVYFDMNYTSRREFLEMQQKVLQSRLLSLGREITDCRAKTREDLQSLYSKIVGYVMQRSNLGSATDINAVRETTAALQSVFPQSQLATFMSLLKQDKEKQLTELSLIVSGIRLFNKDSNKGGESIQNLPAILNEAVPAAVADLEIELAGSQRLAWRYTALLEKISEQEQPEFPVHPDLLKQALYNTRQHEAFLKFILADIILCAKEVTRLQSDLETRMTLLRDSVHTNTTVSTSQVFPHFTAVATLWAGLDGEMLLLSMLTNLVPGLRAFLSAQSLLSPEQLELLLHGLQVPTDTDRSSVTAEERIVESEMSSCEWCFPESTTNFEHVPLQFKGFCGFTLIKKNGLLLPGNPNTGVLKHKEKYYAFSSKSAAYEFASNADEHAAAVVELAKRTPELIQLLQLHQEFASVTPYSEMQSGQKLLVKAICKSDSSTQTEIHPLETNIVKSYEWNEWELRRRAIKLANLRNKVTRSMQTDLSHMRRHNSTQTFLPKDGGSQTKRDGESDVPKPQVYLSGLRGGTSADTHMTKVDLTRAVDE